MADLLAYGLSQVAGYAVGGGHILHMVCDLTIAADNAIFGQTGPKVLSLASVPVSNVSVKWELELLLIPIDYVDQLPVCRLEVLMLVTEVPSCLVW